MTAREALGPELPERVWRRADRVDGTYHREDCQLLWEYCLGRWLELGAYKGRSTIVLASTGYPGTVIDWFRGSPEHGAVDTYEEFCENMSGLLDRVTVIVNRYERVSPRALVPRLRLLHLDGEHSYEATADAFWRLSPLLSQDGVVILHDVYESPWPAVGMFVSDLAESGRWGIVARGKMSAVLRRKEDES